ncbi:MAG: O-antigen polysaccharide polymerase Wzy [Kibdelosporangium sp.]
MLLVALNLAGSLLILAWLYRRGRARNVLFSVAAVFVFFAFGPLVNLLLDQPVYFGIVTGTVSQASTGFLLALVGLLAADLIKPQRSSFDVERLVPVRTYDLLPLVLMCLASYAAYVLATGGPEMIGADKLARIELAGQWHYPYLLLETFALALYVIARRTRFTRNLYWVNAAFYLVYCLVTTERDFIFVGFALLIQRQLFSRGVRSGRLILFGTAGVVLASGLATVRENLEFGVAQTLNQGPVLFVDSFVMNAVPESYPYRLGQTYLDAATSVLQVSWSDRPPLDEWLVSLYAPGWIGGYGFSLTAEAYLNFGMLGIPVVFALIGLGVRSLVNRCDQSDLAAYLTVLAIAGLLNALRGDSAQLLKIVVYGMVFFAVLHIVSSATDSHQLRRAAGQGDGQGRGGAVAGRPRRPGPG